MPSRRFSLMLLAVVLAPLTSAVEGLSVRTDVPPSVLLADPTLAQAFDARLDAAEQAARLDPALLPWIEKERSRVERLGRAVDAFETTTGGATQRSLAFLDALDAQPASRIRQAIDAEDRVEAAIRAGELPTVPSWLDPFTIEAPPSAIAQHARLSEALMALAQDQGLELTPEERQAMSTLDALDHPHQEALTRVVDAILETNRVTREVLPLHDTQGLLHRLDILTQKARHGELDPHASFLALASTEMGIDLVPLLEARARLAQAVYEAGRTWQTQPEPPSPRVVFNFCPFFAIDLIGVANTHSDDCIFIFDVSGTDHYHNNAGGTGHNVLGSCWTAFLAAVVIDMQGDDEYGDPNAPRDCGANGGGWIGAGNILDAGGDDRYYAHDIGTNGGAAAIGSGLLIDAAGNDQYHAGSAGTNGGATQLASGKLLDAGGSDEYKGVNEGVNGGGALLAVGLLIDADSSTNTFTASDGGVNGGGNTGVGILLRPGLGVDTYSAGNLGANGGASGLFGAGVLVDAGGMDKYVAGSNGTNGGGDLFGHGILVDSDGTDTYSAGSRGTNGGAHDGGTGILFDVGGSDAYGAGGSGANGGAAISPTDVMAHVSVGLLLDTGGNDHYTTRGDGGANGGAFTNVSLSGVGSAASGGHLIDLGGDDEYVANNVGANGGAAAAPSNFIIGMAFGMLIDLGLTGEGALASSNDRYFASDWGTNGGAVTMLTLNTGLTLATGFLLDVAGDDTVTASSFGTNGGAYGAQITLAIGLFVNIAGNDRYQADAWGADGTASNALFALLLDIEGDDVYADTEPPNENGSGPNVTKFPKGFLIGAQIDV